MKRVALYLRVSTAGQTIENQRRALLAVAKRHKWNVTDVFKDEGVSGAKGREDRRGFGQLCDAIDRRKIDMVAVWSIDRLGRTLSRLVEFLADLKAKNVDLYVETQGIDTSTSAGKAMFQMMGVFAEFERAVTVERIHAGLARARAQGKRLGRPRLGDDKKKLVLALLAEGKGIHAAAGLAHVGVSFVQRVIGEKSR
jgi:DNA invertase Pin-like site-specific DNA recombinase